MVWRRRWRRRWTCGPPPRDPHGEHAWCGGGGGGGGGGDRRHETRTGSMNGVAAAVAVAVDMWTAAA